MRVESILSLLLLGCSWIVPSKENRLLGTEPVRITVFNVDASPRIGKPLAYDRCREVTQPLSCRGIILHGAVDSIVLCAIDWIGIANGSHDEFRRRLARAAGTSMDRVCVHALHQHDAPRFDSTSYQLLAAMGRADEFYDADLFEDVVSRVEAAIAKSMQHSVSLTRLGFGAAEVHDVASNRRILGPGGLVRATRYTACRDDELRQEPVGVIDPWFKHLIFANDERPIAVLSSYATHPQSYYRTGKANPDFPGMARDARQTLTDTFHVHFTGAGGNIGAGKFNDGSIPMRQTLAERLEDAMRRAWYATNYVPLSAEDIEWRSEQVQLPVNPNPSVEQLKKILAAPDTPSGQLVHAAEKLAFAERMLDGHAITIGCLHAGDNVVLFMPGELFVEYQLAAQAMRPDKNVIMAAYGDYGPFYIGTRVSHPQGGYEVSNSASNVSPEVETVLMTAIRNLLDVSDSSINASDFTER